MSMRFSGQTISRHHVEDRQMRGGSKQYKYRFTEALKLEGVILALSISKYLADRAKKR
jgi:hypothetical protein